MPPSGLLRTIQGLIRRAPRVKMALVNLYNSYRMRPVTNGGPSRVTENLYKAWLDDGIPKRQRAVVEPELAASRAGKQVPAFDALVDALVHNISDLESKSLLEIGCSSGYYAEVLGFRGVAASYRGCDFSPAFIRLARELYPSIPFDVEDATRLSYKDDAFDIVVSGGCILHISEYEKAISEAARVSREFVIFHRTPVLHIQETASYSKKAYGVEMLEIHFNEKQLVRSFAERNLLVTDIGSYMALPANSLADVLIFKTYVCRKQK